MYINEVGFAQKEANQRTKKWNRCLKMDDSLFFPLSVSLFSQQVELKFRSGFPFSDASCTCCNKEVHRKEDRVVLTSVTPSE